MHLTLTNDHKNIEVELSPRRCLIITLEEARELQVRLKAMLTNTGTSKPIVIEEP